MLTLAIKNQAYETIKGAIDHEKQPQLYEATGTELAVLAIKDYSYQPGDQIVVTTTEKNQYLIVQLDETLAPTLVYLAEKQWIFPIPLSANQRKANVETSFLSKRHHLFVRAADAFEIEQYQNLAFNPHDQKQANGAFPHATANVETRDEAIFFAKNAIDGKYGNHSHGSYPFTSWGINQQADAQVTVEFGREVWLDRVRLLLRGDFPHDSYWTEVTLAFSDGSQLTMPTTASLDFQTVTFPAKCTTKLTLKHLQKAPDASPFPALTQLEAFGWNLKQEGHDDDTGRN